MRIKVLLMLLLLTITNSFAQKTKKMKENAGYGKAKFYVFKSDGFTKHGEYKITSYTPPFRNIMKGQYTNGKKNGLWIEKYDKSGSPTRIQGSYQDDEKIGEWKYFDQSGDLIHVFDHSKNELIKNSECGTEKEYEVELNGQHETKKMTCPPTRIGGIEIFTRDLSREISKKSPFEINSRGRTNINIDEKLSFFITKENTITGIEFSGKAKNEKLAQVIENYLSQNSYGWICGSMDDEKIKAKITIPIKILMMF